jgi:RNA polymerase sigma factor (sigma-70 family)
MANLFVREYSQLKRVVNSYIADHPTPTKEDNTKNLKWLRTLQAKTDPESIKEAKKLRHRIILCNGGFGMKYVLKYYNLLNDEQAISELFQESMIGIAEAVDSFNVDKEVSFVTYAFFHVKKRMIDFIKKNKLVRAPRDIAKNLRNVNIIIDSFVSKERHAPNAREIQKELRKQFHVILDLSVINSIILLLDLNSSSAEDSFMVEYSDQLSNPPETNIVSLLKSDLERDLAILPEKEQKRLRLRFGLDGSPLSPEETCTVLGETEEEE